MTRHPAGSDRDPRFGIWIGSTAALFLAAMLVGFILLPSAQEGAGDSGLWQVICRAVGLPGGSAQNAAPVTGQSASSVAWTVATREMLTRGDPVRGAGQATGCNNCHGVGGVSEDAAIPSLAGQSLASIFKQLEDYKTRRRDAAVMGVYVDPLSQQALVDLATYYASLKPPTPTPMEGPGASSRSARNLIEVGIPMRSIPSCASCHGPSGYTLGAAALEGQQRAYLEEQLQALKSGSRHNDISEQMRSIARQLTQDEIQALATIYSATAANNGRQ